MLLFFRSNAIFHQNNAIQTLLSSNINDPKRKQRCMYLSPNYAELMTMNKILYLNMGHYHFQLPLLNFPLSFRPLVVVASNDMSGLGP